MNVGEGVGGKEPLYSVDGNVNLHSICGNHYGISFKKIWNYHMILL
jgi:hypothetical protein